MAPPSTAYQHDAFQARAHGRECDLGYSADSEYLEVEPVLAGEGTVAPVGLEETVAEW